MEFLKKVLNNMQNGGWMCKPSSSTSTLTGIIRLYAIYNHLKIRFYQVKLADIKAISLLNID